MKTEKIKIDFGKPTHGWLPLSFSCTEVQLTLYVSNVPSDPMAQLCDALIQGMKGMKLPQEVIWHEEPSCYSLQLSLCREDFNLALFASDAFAGNKELVCDITGSFDEIILPLYRGVKKFYSCSFSPTDWAEIDPKRLEMLTDLKEIRKP